jgi:hypothetical protein
LKRLPPNYKKAKLQMQKQQGEPLVTGEIVCLLPVQNPCQLPDNHLDNSAKKELKYFTVYIITYCIPSHSTKHMPGGMHYA